MADVDALDGTRDVAVEPQGWYQDPYGVHDARWISDGDPTALVRNGTETSVDPPPLERPELPLVPVDAVGYEAVPLEFDSLTWRAAGQPSSTANEGQASFVLSPIEASLSDIVLRGDVVIIRVSTYLRLLYFGFVGLCGIPLLANEQLGMGNRAHLGLVGLVVLLGVSTLRSAVIATPTELRIRGVVRTRRIDWADIVDIVVYAIRGDSLGGPQVACEVWLRNGRAAKLGALTSNAWKKPWLDGRNLAEVKAQLLHRYKSHFQL